MRLMIMTSKLAVLITRDECTLSAALEHLDNIFFMSTDLEATNNISEK